MQKYPQIFPLFLAQIFEKIYAVHKKLHIFTVIFAVTKISANICAISFRKYLYNYLQKKKPNPWLTNPCSWTRLTINFRWIFSVVRVDFSSITEWCLLNFWTYYLYRIPKLGQIFSLFICKHLQKYMQCKKYRKKITGIFAIAKISEFFSAIFFVNFCLNIC